MPRFADAAHIRSLKARGLISRRAADRAGFEGVAGQGERSRSDAGWGSDRDVFDYAMTSQDVRRYDAGNQDLGAISSDHNNDSRF
jgi:hypothetical protein